MQTFKFILKILLLTLFSTASLWLLTPFISGLLLAGLVAYIVFPVYLRFEKKINSPTVAAALFSGGIGLIVLVGVSALIFLLASQIQSLVQFLNEGGLKELLPASLFAKLPIWGNELANKWSQFIHNPQNLKNTLSHLKNYNLWENFSKSISIIPHIGLNLITFFLVTFALLKEHQRITHFIQWLCEYFQPKLYATLQSSFLCLRSISLSFLVVGITIGTLMTIVYVSIGLTVPFLMGLLTALSAMVPFLFPVLYILLFLFLWLAKGKLITALVVLAIAVILDQASQFWLHPYVVGKISEVHFLVTFFGLVGGLSLFGIAGILLGPLLLNTTVKLLALGGAYLPAHASKHRMHQHQY